MCRASACCRCSPPLRLNLSLILFLTFTTIIKIQGDCSPVLTTCGPGCYYAGETTSCGFACIARVCDPVGVGHYSLNNDNERRACPRATFSNITEAATCEPCPRDTYNDLKGQEVCKPCPPGTHTDGQTGQDTLADCSLIPSPMPTPIPSRLPITIAPHPSMRPSSFPSESNPSFEPSVDPTIDSISPTCTRPSSTPSARHVETPLPTSFTIPPTSSHQPPSAIEPSESAIPTSLPTSINLDCPSTTTSILRTIAMVAVFTSLVVTYRQMPSRTPALFYIGLDYLQLLSFLGTNTPFTWPKVVDSMLSALAVFNFHLDAALPLGCMLSISHETEILVLLSMPLIVGAIISLINTACIIRGRSFAFKFAGIAFGWFYFGYLHFTSSSFGAMVGSTDAGPDRMLTTVGAIAFKVYGISFPLLVARSLFKQQTRYGINSVQIGESTNAFMQRYWLLCGPFQSKRWYWSVVVLTRKLWLVCATFLWRGRKPLVLGCVLTVLFVLSGVVNFTAKPYMELSQEMVAPKSDTSREDAAIDVRTQKFAIRRNVDLILHLSLCLMALIGAISTELLMKDGEGNWKVNAVLSLGALVLILSSFYLLIYSAWFEVSRAKQILPSNDGRWNGTDVSHESQLINRMSNSLGSRFAFGRKRGPQVVPSQDSSSSKSGGDDCKPSSAEEDY